MKKLGANERPLPTKMWAITGRWNNTSRPFFYTGTGLSRSDIIAEHVGYRGNRTWKECRSVGDRAIKVLVTPL